MRYFLLLFFFCLPAQAVPLFIEDFESGNLGKFNLNIAPTNSVQGNRVHSGTKALFYDPAMGSSAGGLAAAIPSSTTVYAKFWWWVPPTITGGAGHHAFRFTKRIGDQFTSHWETDTSIDAGGGFNIDILFHDDGVDSNLTYHHLVQLPTSQWFQFAILSVLNTPGQSNGALKVWINGAQRINATNVLYRKSGSSMNGYDTFLLTSNFDGAGTESAWYMDDVIVSNTDDSGTTPPVLLPPAGLRLN